MLPVARLSSVPQRDGDVTESERFRPFADTFESTASRTGVMTHSCLPRIMAFHRNSNFFQPAAYAKCFTRCLTVPCVKDAEAILSGTAGTIVHPATSTGRRSDR